MLDDVLRKVSAAECNILVRKLRNYNVEQPAGWRIYATHLALLSRHVCRLWPSVSCSLDLSYGCHIGVVGSYFALVLAFA